MSRTPTVPDLPELPSGATLDQVVQWLQQLRTQNLAREPVSVGDPLQKFVTRNELVGFNLLAYSSDQVIGAGSAAGGTVIIGGGGPGGGGTTPDLTPPSPIAGLTVTATLTNFFVQFAAPTYPQGHGNAHTSIYAANWSGTGALPTFADAVEVYQVTGAATIAIVPGQIGTTTCFWAGSVSVDGVRQVDGAGPTGGTHGVSATTGKIGNSDLGPLIVQAGNLANGAVTASKLAAGAVGLTAFAAGLTPVEVVATLPTTGNFQGRTVVLTADNKLYRYAGSAFTRDVDGADLLANSITTGSIAAGAINAAQIAAGAVTTGKLLVTGQGRALNSDPTMVDVTAWPMQVGTSAAALGTGSPGGLSAIGFTATGSGAFAQSTPFPITAGKTYKISVWLNSSSSSGVLYIRLSCLNASGATLSDTVTGQVPVTTTFEAIAMPTSWTQYVGYITPGAGSVSALLGIHTNWATGTGTTYASDFRCEEYVGADLIVDGAITANKIAANAIAVGTAAIQNGAIINAMIGNAAIDDAKIVSCAVGKLTAGSVAVGEYIRSTGFVAGSAGWSISGNGSAEFGFAMIRGTLLASQVSANLITSTMIDSRGLSIEDVSGNVILSAGKPLAAQIVPGGGNLYKNGDFAVTTAGAAAPPDFFASYNNSGATVVHAVSTAGGGAIGSANYWRQTLGSTPTGVFGIYLNGGWVGFQNNADYVLSFYARVSSGSAAIGSTMDIRWNHGPATQALIINPPLTTGWQRYVVQINFGANTLDANGCVTVSGTLPNSGSYIDFSCVQVETGTAASGFAAEVYVDASGVVQGAIGGSGTAVANSLLNSSIADKLSKSAPSILSSTVSINATSGAGFVAGTLTWNSAGVRTSGSGIAMTPGGLLGVNSGGTTTFSIDASTGNAFFAGTLASGTASVVAANGAAGSGDISGSSVPQLDSGDIVLVPSGTITNGGAPVTASLQVNVIVTLPLTYNCTVLIAPTLDGSIASVGGYYATEFFNSGHTAAGTYGAQGNVSATFRFPVSAGTHSFGVRVVANFYNGSTGAGASPSSTRLQVEAYGVVQENRA